jgi:CRP-like cAMP-binding protein
MTISIAKILKESSHSKTFDKHRYIYQEGEKPEQVYYITEGLVGLYALSSSGKEVLLRVFGPNQYFGHRSFLSQGPYHATAYTLKKTQLNYIHVNDLEKILHTNNQVTLDMARNLACELLRAENRLRDLTDKSAKQRIIQALIFLHSKYPAHQWSRKEIGDFASATLETVTRVLTDLNQENLIIKEGRKIIIQDEDALFAFSESL